MTGHTPGGPTPRPRPAGTAAPDHGTAALHRWDGTDRFATGTSEGLRPADAAPAFPGRTALVWDAAIGSEPYADPFGHRPGTWQYARWTSPWTAVGLDPDGTVVDPDGTVGAHELVPSWTVTGPVGTRLTVELQVRGAAGAESGWFTMARWAPGDEVVHRTTVPGQADAFGTVEVDTFTAAPDRPVTAFRVRGVLLRAVDGELPPGHAAEDAPPALHSLAVLASRAPAEPPRPAGGPGGAWGTVLDVPQRSQEVHTGHCPQYDGGGEAWAGPACTAMLTAYFGRGPSAAELRWLDPQDPAPDVDFTARAVYDYAYRGCGNWAFNAAYPARYGLLGLVTRLRSLTELERFILADIPVATAQAARTSELGGYAAVGTIMVVRGFTAHGDVVVNDPLSPTDDAVRRTYPRADFERVWLSGGGVVYLVHPPDRPLPTHAPGTVANW